MDKQTDRPTDRQTDDKTRIIQFIKTAATYSACQCDDKSRAKKAAVIVNSR